MKLAGTVYLIGALVLGAVFLFYSVRAAIRRTTRGARELLLASVLYLPALFGLMVLNR
jgi:protoheme IX farnesyltransferase